MTREDIATRARELVAQHLAVDPAKVTDTASFVEDLGADSLDVVEISMLFEDEWDICIEDEEAEQAKTFGNAVNFLAKKLGVGVVAA